MIELEFDIHQVLYPNMELLYESFVLQGNLSLSLIFQESAQSGGMPNVMYRHSGVTCMRSEMYS